MLSVVAHKLEEQITGPSELLQGLRVLREFLGFLSCDGESLGSLGPFQDLEGPLVLFVELGSVLGLPVEALAHVFLFSFFIDLKPLLLTLFWGEGLVASITLETEVIGLILEGRNLVRVKRTKRTSCNRRDERLSRRQRESLREENAGDHGESLLMKIDD